MNIDFEMYRIFYVVANNGNITKASEELKISPTNDIAYTLIRFDAYFSSEKNKYNWIDIKKRAYQLLVPFFVYQIIVSLIFSGNFSQQVGRNRRNLLIIKP